ncbi:MAG: glycosyltransferase family 2 protein [Geobacteraceae bacterium]|nr:MAG: glycosyltransferase family 2 protein [Geobacteraceae bacterium]RPI73494.1 MAG: glycosyltransferase family 2 protein [Geobacteraceae bacterium]
MMKVTAMGLIENMVSVVIPAYNQPTYLQRALESVLEQTYRPIEVIVADDCSPRSLEPVIEDFASREDEHFKIRYFRQTQNLGVIENFHSGVAQAKGKYMVPLAHDNRFTDRGFFAESIKIMSSHPGCHLCYGNAQHENRHGMALGIPDVVKFRDGWSLLEGKDFIRYYRRGGMGCSHTMVLDHEMALSLRAYDEPFVVNAAISRRLGIAQDDLFSYVFLLSGMGSVGLCEKLVGEIGTPPESYSRSNRKWKDTKGKVKFLIFYNIYRADLKGKYAADVKRAAFKQALEYIDYILLDFRIAQYYNWSPGIILLMGLSLPKNAWSELRYAFKRGVNLLKPKTFKKTKR